MTVRKYPNPFSIGVAVALFAASLGCIPGTNNGNTVDPDCQDGPLQCSLSNAKTLFQQDKCTNTLQTIKVCEGEEVCQEPSGGGDAYCGTPVAEECKEGPITCSLSNKNALFQRNKCLGKNEVVRECPSGQFCEEPEGEGDAYCTCSGAEPASCVFPNDNASLYEPSEVSGAITCDEEAGATQQPTENCGFGVICYIDEQAKRNNGVALCATSIDPIHEDKPYYAHGCANEDFLRYPTQLPIDCRCRNVGNGQGGVGGTAGVVDPANRDPDNGGHPGGTVLNCTNATLQLRNEWPVKYGEGPDVVNYYREAPNSLEWTTGVLDHTSREFYNLVTWIDPDDGEEDGAIVAFNLDTGNRRMVTGNRYDDNGEKIMSGSGYLSPHPRRDGEETPLRKANVVRLSTFDAMLYTASAEEITKVHPDTGERTLVWKRQVAGDDGTGDISATYGQCFRPGFPNELPQGVQLVTHSFEVGPAGEFFLGFRGQREGDGVIEISPDASTCRFVSRSGGRASSNGTDMTDIPDEIGTGKEFKFPPKALLHHDNKLFYNFSGDLYSLDTTTGNRSRVSGDGGFAGIGEGSVFWDENRKVIYTSGNSANITAIIDPVTGQKESVLGDTGRQNYTRETAIMDSVYGGARSAYGLFRSAQSLAFGGFVADPDNADLMYGVLATGALFVMERSTFNTMVISW